jgi:hypothetical protein
VSDQKKNDVSAGRPYLGCWEHPSETCEACGSTAEEVWLRHDGSGVCRKCLDGQAAEAGAASEKDAPR